MLPHVMQNNLGLAVLEGYWHEQLLFAADLPYPWRGWSFNLDLPPVNTIPALIEGFDLVANGGTVQRIGVGLISGEGQDAPQRSIITGHSVGKILDLDIAERVQKRRPIIRR